MCENHTTRRRLAGKDTITRGARSRRTLLTTVARAGTAMAVVVVVGVAIAACGGSVTSTTTMAQEGIEGTVTIGPPNPVSQPGEIDSRPYAATFVIRALADDKIVATVTSAADGTFRVSVPAGEYVVESQQTSTFPFLKPQQVTVNPGEYTIIVVAYDSGIR